MRVATFNVHDCIGRQGGFDPGRTAKVLAELDADLIALQEVTVDPAGELIRRFEAATGLRGIDGSLFERGVGRYGNLVLARDPVIETRLHDLSFAEREPRGVVEVLLDVGEGPFRVLATHLGLRSVERRMQIQRLAAMVADDYLGVVLLGDFNVWWWSTALRQLSAAGFRQASVRSFPTWPSPVVALDRVLVRRPLTIRRCWRHESPLARIASDHFPVLADLQPS